MARPVSDQELQELWKKAQENAQLHRANAIRTVLGYVLDHIARHLLSPEKDEPYLTVYDPMCRAHGADVMKSVVEHLNVLFDVAIVSDHRGLPLLHVSLKQPAAESYQLKLQQYVASKQFNHNKQA